MIKTFTYKPNGTCSQFFEFEVSDNIIQTVKITGGCDGNLKGICNLMRGKTVEEVISAFNGITCGHRKTSCPDQIAKCLAEEFAK